MPPKQAMSDEQAQAAGAALLKNPQFVELFQKAMGDEKMPEDGPAREKWLKNLQTKLAQEAEQESKRELETPVRDEEGEWMWIKPDPGFCVKANTVQRNKKVFINVCKHPRIAEPQPLTDAEADPGMSDAIKYRIPLSCGAARPDVDKKGSPCVVYDVIVNPATIERCSQENEFRRFVAALCMTWIKQKSEPNLDADQFTNINIKAKGTPQIQRIRLSAPGQSGPTNAMGDEIKLPSASGAATAPNKAASTGTRPMVVEVDPAADTKEAAQPPAVERPSASISNEGNYEWSKHKMPTKNPFFRESVPEVLALSVKLPGITTIKELEVSLVGRKVTFVAVDAEDGEDPFFELLLPFPVEETPLKSKFVRATSTLSMHLRVTLPDETLEPEKSNVVVDNGEEETPEQRAKRLKEEKALQERRERIARIEKEEQAVMEQRKAMVDNMNAVQEGRLPPELQKEIDGMAPEQARAMMMRLENKVRRGDGVDQMLDKLPPEVIDNVVRHIRKRLGLAEPAPSKDSEEKRKADAAAAAKRAEAEARRKREEQQSKPVEYNFAKKAEQLIGVKMENRFVFALEH
uniref:PIH1 domain-containing protein 1 n=1 Tax=Neobodo designis TaxID=312471 RepID=A0A7S1MS12_NEODS|mmetsp:Transcript_46138/g.142164  ORF Transcript_46138/g.142164 Transcript_46138/m.142164 type:complete len:576 (+) Transcript_46138:82-1809(+)